MILAPTALLLAFGAGLLSFLLPCTLPLLPGYLAYVSGLAAEDMGSKENRAIIVFSATLFVLGFSLVFVALGATASYLGALLLPYRETLIRLSGAFIIAMALVVLGVLRMPMFYREKRFALGREFGVWSAFPLGMAFAFGWSPCIGPVLASLLAYASTQGTAQQGAVLLFVYALGLGVPFLGLALLAGRMFESVRALRRYARVFDLGGGTLLVVMGVFLVLNQWTAFMAPIMRWYLQLSLPI